MVVLTLGTFDLPHYGHFHFLKECSKNGLTIIGLNTDEFITRYKGKPPILTYKERERTLKEWGYDCVPNNQDDGTIKNVVKLVKPDIIAIGSDWMRKEYLGQIGLSIKYLEKENIWLTYIPYTYGISTTEIKARLQ